jgi:hypothetical protein
MYSNAVKIIRDFCKAIGHPVSTSTNLQWHEIEAYAALAKAQYRALPDHVKISMTPDATQAPTPPLVYATPGVGNPVILEVHTPVPPALIQQIEAYQANP